MFEEEFLKLELIKQIRELGFDEPCIAYRSVPIYSDEEIKLHFDFSTGMSPDRTYFPAPLIQQVLRWFRKKWDYHSYVETFSDGTFDYTITSSKFTEETDYNDGTFQTYEQAEEASIIRMINLVKNEGR